MEINLAPSIFEKLKMEAEMKGLNTEELCKVIIGTYFSVMYPTAIPLPSYRGPIEKLSTMANVLVGQLAAQGAMKCPNCTMKLSLEDIEKGECNSCHYKLSGEG